ncbi:NAD-dependent epimerase/dehydratase family protein [Chelatococcus sp. GCM10030263]|uniref:NAD-dependent epimerase/dehydratase family protein n=1 Tax=Chelatococcus sp. GCM10030263 TaxID=3273387 RepID=UPI00360CB4B0
MSIAITGGTGFVGLALAEALQNAGHPVVLFGSAPLPTRFADAFAEAATFVGDVRDPKGIDSLLDTCAPAAVVHLAAVTPDREVEMSDPAAVIGVNVGGIANVMRSMARLPARPRLILASSVAVYGFDEPLTGSFDEDYTPLKPVSLYGITKLAAEQTAVRLAELYQIDLRIIRLGPVFGPWEHATGLRPLLSPHAQVLDVWSRGEEAILPRALLGDWLYSRDAGRGIAAVLESDRLHHTVYNLGGGVSTSVADWCERLGASPLSRGWRLARPGEEPNILFSLPRDRAPLDIHRITADTGYRPAYPGGRAVEDHLAWLRATSSPGS